MNEEHKPDQARSRSLRVLVVEDDEGISEPLMQGLSREGFEVTGVTTGSEALLASPVDVVLLDLGLPDIDGYALCRKLGAPEWIETVRGVGLRLGDTTRAPAAAGPADLW